MIIQNWYIGDKIGLKSILDSHKESNEFFLEELLNIGYKVSSSSIIN